MERAVRVMSISQTESNKLYGNAAGRCAFKDCREKLTLNEMDKSFLLGQMAHIVARSPTGPRGDSSFPKDKLDTYENLILLCPTCHTKIDKQPNKYPVELLHEIKEKHEIWADMELDKGMSEFGFSELQIAVEVIASGRFTSINTNDETDFDAIAIKDKIVKNKLSKKICAQIKLGVSRSTEVRNFLVEISRGDQFFNEKLKKKFQSEYNKFRQQNLEGDELFEAMLNFAQQGTTTFPEQAASLAILCYLFELCEVFER
jgi:hypothetical protein